MNPSRFVPILADIGVSTSNRTYVTNDPQDGSEWILINGKDQKVIARVYDNHDGPVTVLTRRANAQHTMNCLSMQAIDMNEPFNSVDIFQKGIERSVREDFEDSLQAIHMTHVELSKNGYYLWSSQLLMQSNVLQLRNVYIRAEDINMETLGQEMASIVLESHVTTASFKEIFDTYQHPGLAWDIRLDVDHGRIDRAIRFDPNDRFKRDMIIEAFASTVRCFHKPINEVPSLAIMDAWDIKHVVGKSQSSTPGRVNTIRTFRCVDHQGNKLNLSITYNLD